MRNEVFLDAAYAIALSVPKDLYHQHAILLADHLEATRTRLVTTRAVLLEIGNALSKLRYRHAAVELLQALERDPQVMIVPLSEGLYEDAFALYAQDRIRNGGLPTVCLSS